MATSTNTTQNNTASSIMKSILKTVPLEWILPVIFSQILGTIKNPNSTQAKTLEKVLVPFGQALVEKYPDKICNSPD